MRTKVQRCEQVLIHRRLGHITDVSQSCTRRRSTSLNPLKLRRVLNSLLRRSINSTLTTLSQIATAVHEPRIVTFKDVAYRSLLGSLIAARCLGLIRRRYSRFSLLTRGTLKSIIVAALATLPIRVTNLLVLRCAASLRYAVYTKYGALRLVVGLVAAAAIRGFTHASISKHCPACRQDVSSTPHHDP